MINLIFKTIKAIAPGGNLQQRKCDKLGRLLSQYLLHQLPSTSARERKGKNLVCSSNLQNPEKMTRGEKV